MDNIWAAVDDQLKTLVSDQMGADSAYATLHLATIKATILRDASDWQGWALPAAVISGRFLNYQNSNEHPGIHYQKLMLYSLALIVEGTQEGSVADVKELIKRAETALVQAGLTSVQIGGEKIDGKKPSLERAEIMLMRKSSSLLDQWYAVGFLDFQVVSRT